MTPMNHEWTTPEHALAYLQRADAIPHRTEGEATLLEEVPKSAGRILDLGSGDGRLLDLLLLHCPAASGVAVDFSAPMLERLRTRFAGNPRVQIVEHDLERPLPILGTFDVVASSFAIHHLPHPRKRKLDEEVWNLLQPGGVVPGAVGPGPGPMLVRAELLVVHDQLVEEIRAALGPSRNFDREAPLPDNSADQILLHLFGTRTGPTESVRRRERRDVVRNALRQLGARDAEILTLFAQGLSYKEIGLLMDMRENSANRHCLRALEKLGDLLPPRSALF